MITYTYCIDFSAAVEQVFKIGSMEPGAMLFDASKEFEVSKFPFHEAQFMIFRHFLYCTVRDKMKKKTILSCRNLVVRPSSTPLHLVVCNAVNPLFHMLGFAQSLA